MKYRSLYKYDENLLRKVANLHIDALSYRSFITIFGIKFLLEIYKGLLAEKTGVFIIAQKDSDLIGFVLGCRDSNKILSIMIKKCFVFAKIIIPKVIRRPFLLKKILETAFYFKKEKSIVKPELLVIAVNEIYRSRKIGTDLLHRLESDFRKNGIHRYKVTVHTQMARSNQFYKLNGMKLSNRFNLYNTQWNLFLKDIS